MGPGTLAAPMGLNKTRSIALTNMLRVSKPLFVIASLFVVALASAQQDPFDLKFSKMELLQAKPIQRDIKLTEAQRATMNKFADRHRARVKAFSDEMQAAKR